MDIQPTNTLRIVFVTNNYTPYSGGVVSSITACVNELHKCGHEVFIITLDFLGAKHNDPDYVIRIPSPIKFLYKKNHMAIPWRPNSYVLRIIQDIAPDIIHTHHPFLLGRSAHKAAQKLHIPIAFTYHTMYEHYAHYIPFPRRITQAIIKKHALAFCDTVNGIIVPSSAIKHYLIEHNAQTPLEIIPSGLQSIFVHNRLHTKKQVPKDRFYLLTVGRMVKEKNMQFLLDVFSRLDFNHFSFIIIGYGAEFEPLRDYAYKVLGLSPDHVRFMHKPPQAVIAQWYQKADLFLFSSTCDTQGLVLAEAMAAGLPVVALDGPGQQDIIEHSINGFLVSSADEMVETIATIAQNEILHGFLRENACNTAQRYAPQNTTKKLVNFYRNVIGAF